MSYSTMARFTTGGLLIAAMALLVGCNETDAAGRQTAYSSDRRASAPSPTVAAGTNINVALTSNITSETARPGDSWQGTVTEYVAGGNGAQIPAGSHVNGVVLSAREAVRGSRAMLQLGVRSIVVNGREENITASSEQVIAGSTRARNLGAIAGGAAAGALIGNVVGDGRNATAGGLIGGVAAAGVVANTRGYQVVLTDRTVMSFTVSRTVRVR